MQFSPINLSLCPHHILLIQFPLLIVVHAITQNIIQVINIKRFPQSIHTAYIPQDPNDYMTAWYMKSASQSLTSTII